jgi:hypothetical protein
MEFASPPSTFPSNAQRTSRGRRRRFSCLQISSHSPSGESRSSAPARRATPLGERPKLTSADRLLWVWLCEAWSDWRSALVIVKSETVIGWHRKGFRLFWTWKVRHGQPGRPLESRYDSSLVRFVDRYDSCQRIVDPSPLCHARSPAPITLLAPPDDASPTRPSLQPSRNIS